MLRSVFVRVCYVLCVFCCGQLNEQEGTVSGQDVRILVRLIRVIYLLPRLNNTLLFPQAP